MNNFVAVILLTEVNRLSKEAQQALRRTMEKYIATCRLILYADSTSQIIPAIRSRCLGIKIPCPGNAEIVSILQVIIFYYYIDLELPMSKNLDI